MSRTFDSNTFGKAKSGPAVTLRGKAPNFVSPSMPCGIHKRPKRAPAQPRDYRDRSRKPAQQSGRVLKDGGKRGTCMCDYHDYPQLRLEQEHAILTDAILFDGVIEFCPEPFQYPGYDRLKGCSRDHTDAVCHQYDTVLPGITAAGALMRTCKQYKEDITEDFYPSNEFRRTNVTGSVSLDIFMHMIGLEQAAMLRKLSVCHPELSVIPRSLGALDTYADGQLYIRNVSGMIDASGFKAYGEKRWFDD
ncbi:hypothetical protein DOTSEDRAFT_73942 [Dothistroma septosporum NZE10]|uniref:Uncharacterized protein n=1 Tax=Dothistroma septosporum (strain NZE10 / CBS 128990) TaxID=675120 RepID=N1PHA5_DOTSN|nr:hypothetical protein DOTSEDRAFT_73942 [Dothistroma septosporum NZE10]